MTFNKLKLLKIIKPIWYYSLIRLDKSFYLIDYLSLNDNQKSYFDFCNFYQNKNIELLDIAYQGLNNGYIPSKKQYLSFSNDLDEVTVYEEYIFIRRMFKWYWIYYVFMIRLISLNNPYKELSAFLGTRKVKNINFKYFEYKDLRFNSFSSKLVKNEPLISILIPTLNRYKYLNNALKDLEQQYYKNFEVIIVDQSDSFNESFYENFNLNLVVLYQREKQLWLARNKAIAISRSDFVLFYEDDVRVDPLWISNHLKVIDYFKCDISTGILISDKSFKESKGKFHVSSKFSSGNSMVKKEIFKKVGLFDRQFEKMRMGDAEFGARCVKNGLLIVSNPNSKCIDTKAEDGGLRYFGQWDAFHSNNFFGPKPVPSAIYFWRRYWGFRSLIYYLIQTLPFQISKYKYKHSKLAYIQSFIFFLIFSPFVTIKLLLSWIISSKMIRQGPKIKFIN